MAEDYKPTLALNSAQYPNFVAREFLDLLKTGYSPVTETGTVPGSANSYSILLKHRILANGALTVTSGGADLVLVPHPQAPDSDEAAYSRELQKIRFNSSRVGESYSVTYTPAGSSIAAQYLMQIHRELVAHQTAIGTKVAIAGDTMTGPLILSGDPTTGLGAATKNYVDFTAAAIAAGLDTKPSVKCATTANITLSGEQTIDGVLTSASRVLVKNQSAPAQNGIYVSAAGAWARSTDFDSWAEVPGAWVLVEQGTTLNDTAWQCTSDAGGTLGVTAITWAAFTSTSGGGHLQNTDSGTNEAEFTVSSGSTFGTLQLGNTGNTYVDGDGADLGLHAAANIELVAGADVTMDGGGFWSIPSGKTVTLNGAADVVEGTYNIDTSIGVDPPAPETKTVVTLGYSITHEHVEPDDTYNGDRIRRADGFIEFLDTSPVGFGEDTPVSDVKALIAADGSLQVEPEDSELHSTYGSTAEIAQGLVVRANDIVATSGAIISVGDSGIANYWTSSPGCQIADQVLSNRDVHAQRNVYAVHRAVVGARQSQTGTDYSLQIGSGIAAGTDGSGDASYAPLAGTQICGISTSTSGTHFKNHDVSGTYQGSLGQKFFFDDVIEATGLGSTPVPAANLTGTVALARLSGITNTQIDAAAAIVDTKLATISTAGKVSASALSNITNTQIDAAAGIVDTKLATISTAGKVATTAIAAGTISTAQLINTLRRPVNSSLKTANYTITVSDCMIRFNTTSLALTGTLPPAATCSGQSFVIVAELYTEVLTVSADGSESIIWPGDGPNPSIFLQQVGATVTLMSTGAGWIVQAYAGFVANSV